MPVTPRHDGIGSCGSYLYTLLLMIVFEIISNSIREIDIIIYIKVFYPHPFCPLSHAASAFAHGVQSPPRPCGISPRTCR